MQKTKLRESKRKRGEKKTEGGKETKWREKRGFREEKDIADDVEENHKVALTDNCERVERVVEEG